LVAAEADWLPFPPSPRGNSSFFSMSMTVSIFFLFPPRGPLPSSERVWDPWKSATLSSPSTWSEAFLVPSYELLVCSEAKLFPPSLSPSGRSFFFFPFPPGEFSTISFPFGYLNDVPGTELKQLPSFFICSNHGPPPPSSFSPFPSSQSPLLPLAFSFPY